MSFLQPTGFRRTRSGEIILELGPSEDAVLRQVLTEVLELVEPAEPSDAAADQDPLAAALGIGTATSEPADPALARLFPNAYRDDDEAAADFRRYTEPTLRAAKAAALRTALDSLAPEKVVLTVEQAAAWLRALNDTRLVLGERLEISDDWGDQLAEVADELADDHPLLLMYWVYSRLTFLEETLVDALGEGL